MPPGLGPYQPPRRRRIGLALAALALVAGGTVGGIAVGHIGTGEQEANFSTQTSQAFTGGQEEPNEPEQQAPAPTQAGEGGED